MPYKKLTKLMTKLLVQDMITCLNMFPSKNGISNDLSLAAIILGSANPYYPNIRIPFGAYAQLYLGTTNNTKQITVGIISLLSSNERGVYYFMTLYNWIQLHLCIWTELPINKQLIQSVDGLYTKEK